MIKFIKSAGIALIFLLLTAAALVFISPRFGWRVDTVLSGSMEPALRVGDVVVTRPVELETLSSRDIVTFHSPLNSSVISHRLISIEEGSSLSFRTKGDANEDADPFVLSSSNIIGEVCFRIPYFGYAAQFMKTPLGFLLTLCLPGLIVIIMEIVKIWRILTEREMEKKYFAR